MADEESNQSTLRQMAVRGHQYRESMQFEYYGMEGELFVRPLTDEEFLPIAALLEDRVDMDPEEAKQALEENREMGEEDYIDTSAFDAEFIAIMQRAARLGIDPTQGIAEGEGEEGLDEIISMLQGGKTLEISEKVLELSSDPEKAEAFRGE